MPPKATLTLLWRGRLASCNYACGYCPFAKRRDGRAALARFVDRAGTQRRALRVLFTPWGEALIRRHDRAAMCTPGAMPHVEQVAMQINLSGPLAWLEDAQRASCAAATSSPLAWAISTPTRLATLLAPRPCSRLRCECFIGYAHRRDLPIREAFAHGGLARIPLRVAAA